MEEQNRPTQRKPVTLEKVATGIEGVDHTLSGGLPKGRMTLLLGGPGTGKTLFGMECLYRQTLAGEPGIFAASEVRVDALRLNVLTLGWDLAALEAQRISGATEQPLSPGWPHTDHDQSACRVRAVEVISGIGISSLMDTIAFLRLSENNGELNRTILVLKSRGAKHSNQMREFRITDDGISILSPYVGEGGALTGVARQQEAREALEGRRLARQIQAKGAEVKHLSASLESQIIESRAAVAHARIELDTLRTELQERERGREIHGGMRQWPTDEAAADG